MVEKPIAESSCAVNITHSTRRQPLGAGEAEGAAFTRQDTAGRAARLGPRGASGKRARPACADRAQLSTTITLVPASWSPQRRPSGSFMTRMISITAITRPAMPTNGIKIQPITGM